MTLQFFPQPIVFFATLFSCIALSDQAARNRVNALEVEVQNLRLKLDDGSTKLGIRYRDLAATRLFLAKILATLETDFMGQQGLVASQNRWSADSKTWLENWGDVLAIANSQVSPLEVHVKTQEMLSAQSKEFARLQHSAEEFLAQASKVKNRLDRLSALTEYNSSYKPQVNLLNQALLDMKSASLDSQKLVKTALVEMKSLNDDFRPAAIALVSRALAGQGTSILENSLKRMHGLLAASAEFDLVVSNLIASELSFKADYAQLRVMRSFEKADAHQKMCTELASQLLASKADNEYLSAFQQTANTSCESVAKLKNGLFATGLTFADFINRAMERDKGNFSKLCARSFATINCQAFSWMSQVTLSDLKKMQNEDLQVFENQWFEIPKGRGL
jgi:hypothetical protein